MRWSLALLGSVLGVACQNAQPPAPAGAPAASPSASDAPGAPGASPPPTAASSSAQGSGASPALVEPSPPPSTPPPAPGRVKLPRTTDEPARRTTRPLSRKELERLAALDFETFVRQNRGTSERFTEVRYTTKTRPILGVTITIEPCPPARPGRKAAPVAGGACTPMELARWQARTDQLKQFLSKELVARPDTRFEIGTRELLGTPAIYTYQLGAFFGKDERDNTVGAYSDAYILYYNDGVNQIRVNASYLDDALGGTDKLLAVAPEEDLEKLAVAFMSYYLHAWSHLPARR